MLGILRMGILRMLGESFAFAYRNNSLAIKEQMRHPENGCFGLMHFMKSLVNGLVYDDLKFVRLT
jgi:hypothetical protein